jgi:hypothetical protein
LGGQRLPDRCAAAPPQSVNTDERRMRDLPMADRLQLPGHGAAPAARSSGPAEHSGSDHRAWRTCRSVYPHETPTERIVHSAHPLLSVDYGKRGCRHRASCSAIPLRGGIPTQLARASNSNAALSAGFTTMTLIDELIDDSNASRALLNMSDDVHLSGNHRWPIG